MAANPLSLPRVQRPPVYFSTPAFELVDFPCIFVRKKPANAYFLAAAALLLLMDATLLKFSMIRVQCCLYYFKKWGSMTDTEALLRANTSLIFTPFEYVRHRIQALQSLGITGFGLSRFIVKRPDVLTAQKIQELLSFLVNDDANLELIGS